MDKHRLLCKYLFTEEVSHVVQLDGETAQVKQGA